MKNRTVSVRGLIGLALSLLICLGLIASALPASAEQHTGLLVLGDSITTGYALPDYSASDPYKCASYANRLADALGLKAKDTYFNRAKDGDTSGDLRALLPTISSQVADARLIVISIGGNDLLRLITSLASYVTGTNVTSFSSALSAIVAAGSDKIVEALGSVDLQKTFDDAIEGYGTNLDWIINFIKEKNPTARVIFLAQYDPISALVNLQSAITVPSGSGEASVPSGGEIPKVDISAVIGRLNAKLYAAAEGKGVEVADVPSVIDAAAIARTNILQFDIHPNTAGHGAIFELLKGMLGLGEVTTECQHEWSEWVIVSEGEIWEPYVVQRECSKCGEKETLELPARDTKPEETTAEEPGTTPRTDTGDSNGKPPLTIADFGCTSFAPAGAIMMLIPAAIMFRKRRK